jgi:hypothetical protein
MKKLLFIPLLFCATFLSAQNFNLQEGDYAGTLTYIDYTSGKQVILDQMDGKFVLDKGTPVLSTEIREGTRVYPSESRIQKNGNQVTFGDQQWTLLDEKSRRGKITEWTLSRRGIDGNDNKPCTFKLLIRFQDVAVTWRKEVKFDDQAEYFMRNQYDLRKKGVADARLYASYIGIGTDEFGVNPTVAFQVKGNSWLRKQIYVRIQLPEDANNRNFGFVQGVSRFNSYSFKVPVGAKIWVCEGNYWDNYFPREYLYKTVGALDGGEISVDDLRFDARKLR